MTCFHVVVHEPAGVLFELQPEGVRAVHTAVLEDASRSVEDVAGSFEGNADLDDGPPFSRRKEHLFLQYYSSRSLRRLLLLAAEEKVPGAAGLFATELWNTVLKGHCARWIGTHAEKVLGGLLHCGVKSVVEEATLEIQNLMEQPLKEWAGRFMNQKGKINALQ